MIKNISFHIQRLLFERDILIIPEFGGFISRQVPARHDQISMVMYPPAKKVLFNSQLLTDDGVLIQSLVENYGWSYLQAQAHLKSLIKDWKQRLQAGETVDLERFGQFSLANGDVSFEQKASSNLSQSFFGLEPAVALPLKFAESNLRLANSSQIRPLTVEKPPMSYRVFKRSSIAAITVLTLTASYLYLLSFQPDTAAQAGIDIFRSPIPIQQEKPNIEAQQLQELKEGIDAIKADLAKHSATIPDTVSTTEKAFQPEPNSLPENESMIAYHIIGGSYAERQKAQEACTELTEQGYSKSRLLEDPGRYRLSLSSFENEQEARDALTSIQANLLESAWILTMEN